MNAKLSVRNQYPNLKKGNARIAELILQEPHEFLKMTAVEIAERCQTSSASVIRFIKKSGFPGLNEFKLQLSHDLAEEEQDSRMDTIVEYGDSVPVICQKMSSVVRDIHHELFQMLDPVQLEKAIHLLQTDAKIFILGIGASGLPAYDLYHKLRRIDKNVTYEFDTHMSVEFINFAKPDDIVVAFSYSGLSTEITYPCEIAKKNGARIIAVTRNASNYLKELADVALMIPNTEHLTRIGAFGSKYASMIIADLLYLGVLQESSSMHENELLGSSRLTRRLKKKEK